MRLFRLFLYVLIICLVSSCPAKSSAAAISEEEAAALRSEMEKLRDEMSIMREHYETLKAALDKSRSDKDVQSETPDDELAALRSAAVSTAGDAVKASVNPDIDKKFEAGSLGLQASNPEISVVGDYLLRLRSQKDNRETFNSEVRQIGIHFESYLDPYSKFKAAYPVTENGSNLGEAYMTRFNVGRNLNLTVGRFRQQFGVVNRWHRAGLEQVDFPLALRRIFGAGGLAQSGISLDWEFPGSRDSNMLTFQLTQANNAALFAGNSRKIPSALVHYKNYRDLNQDTYLELGLTAMAGCNDRWSETVGKVQNFRLNTLPTYVFGLDVTRLWEPADRMRYKNFTWRSELYYMLKDVYRPDGTGEDRLRAWGGYTDLHWKTDRTWESGIQIEYYRPDTKYYAAQLGMPNFVLHAVNADSAHEWQFSPYVTWQPSPWVKWRLQYDHQQSRNMDKPDNRLMLQCIWAAGPHKHERY